MRGLVILTAEVESEHSNYTSGDCMYELCMRGLTIFVTMWYDYINCTCGVWSY